MLSKNEPPLEEKRAKREINNPVILHWKKNEQNEREIIETTKTGLNLSCFCLLKVVSFSKSHDLGNSLNWTKFRTTFLCSYMSKKLTMRRQFNQKCSQ